MPSDYSDQSSATFWELVLVPSHSAMAAPRPSAMLAHASPASVWKDNKAACRQPQNCNQKNKLGGRSKGDALES